MEREHWHWKPSLDAVARTGNRRAAAILAEGKHPGKYFDGLTHMIDVVRIMREEKENGATHIGIFGSRIKDGFLGKRVHRPLDSDVDMLVVKNLPNGIRTVTRAGVGDGINVLTLSQDEWDYSVRNARDDTAIREIMRSVKWVWIKKGEYPLKVGHWVKTTF